MEIDSIQTNILEVGNQTINDLSNYMTHNIIINGSFSEAGYATGVDNPTSADEYCCLDRWRMRRANNAANCRFGRSSIDPPSSGQCLFMKRNSGDSNTNDFALQQQVESVYIYPIRGKKLTISFQLRPESEWITDWGTSTVKIATGTTLNESIAIGDTATGEVVLLEETISAPTVADTWHEYKFTTDVVVPSNAGCLYIKFLFGVTGSASADNVLRVGEVKVEPGEVATPWLDRPTSVEELLCQRYYQKSGTDTNAQHIFVCDVTSGSSYYGSIYFRPYMRTTPTITATRNTESNMNGTFEMQAGDSKQFRWRCDADGTGRGLVRFDWQADAEL